MRSPFDIAADLVTPVSAFRKLASFSPRFLLESVEGGERLGRYSFIGLGDALSLRLEHNSLIINGEHVEAPADSDALLNAFPTADLAVQNSGGLRTDISQGVITREQIYEVMPFENRLLLVEMTGAAVETLLRIGSSGTHGIFQISGGRYRFDPELIEGSDLDGDGVVGEWETDRLCWVEVDGAPLDLNRLYQVVVSDFIFEGGDHAAPAFLSSRIVSQGEMVRDAMMAYLLSQERCLLDETGGGEGRSARIETGVCDVY